MARSTYEAFENWNHRQVPTSKGSAAKTRIFSRNQSCRFDGFIAVTAKIRMNKSNKTAGNRCGGTGAPADWTSCTFMPLTPVVAREPGRTGYGLPRVKHGLPTFQDRSRG